MYSHESPPFQRSGFGDLDTFFNHTAVVLSVSEIFLELPLKIIKESY